MKNLLLFIALICLFSSCQENKATNQPTTETLLPSNTNAPNEPFVITSDIDLFWAAYDKITSTDDTIKQLQYLQEDFIDKGSKGLDGVIRARNYTPKEYLAAINDYPKYWASIRKNTHKVKGLSAELEAGVAKLKALYPDLKPAKIYFTVGALRTNGTTINGMLLIGSELAMGDSTTVTSEFPESRGHLPSFFKNNPIDNIVALNIHEYIHTQQNAIGGYDLLSQCIYEGVAEFVPVIALGEASSTPAIKYGKENFGKVRAKFEKELFSLWINNWIWNSMDNEFGVRDLGYYVGYEMAEMYYNKATDKALAIKEMIELDYTSQTAMETFSEKSGYFSKPIVGLLADYEKSRPTVVNLEGFENGDQAVNPALTEFVVEFSEPLDPRFRSTDFGEMGKEHFPELIKIEFSESNKKARYTVKLKPNTQYQMKIDLGYRTPALTPLVPYLVEFKTTK